MLGQGWLPYRYALVGGPSATTSGIAKCGIATNEIGAVVLKRVQVTLVGERKDEIDVTPSLCGRTAHQLEIARREHHRGKRAERVTEAPRTGAVDGDFLPLHRLVEPNRELMLARRSGYSADVKAS